MRRILGLSGIIGLILASQGCHHVGGKCDCEKDPLPGSCNYYSSSNLSAYGLQGTPTTPTDPAAAPMPKTAPAPKDMPKQ